MGVQMKVLVITGNPKKKGALATLTDEAGMGARARGAEVEEVRLADLDIGYCRFCMKCWEDKTSVLGECALRDDMAGVIEKVREADGLILACPTSGGHPNALMKTFIERRRETLPSWAERSKFDHFYRLCVNTRINPSEAGKVLRVGDPVEFPVADG